MPSENNESVSESDGFFNNYSKYADTLRTWFVAYGVGGPAVILSQDAIFKAISASGHARVICLLFGIGVALQICLAILNKTCSWCEYFARVESDFATTLRYKNMSWIFEQYWIDATVDIATALLFGAATMILLATVFP